MSGATLRSAVTSSDINEYLYGTWQGSVPANSNCIISENTTYYIPIFVNSAKYATSAT